VHDCFAFFVGPTPILDRILILLLCLLFGWGFPPPVQQTQPLAPPWPVPRRLSFWVVGLSEGGVVFVAASRSRPRPVPRRCADFAVRPVWPQSLASIIFVFALFGVVSWKELSCISVHTLLALYKMLVF